MNELELDAEDRVLAIRGSYDAPGFEACVEAEMKKMKSNWTGVERAVYDNYIKQEALTKLYENTPEKDALSRQQKRRRALTMRKKELQFNKRQARRNHRG